MTLSEYELQRQARIAANKARMDSLGIQEAASVIQMEMAPRRVRVQRAPGHKLAPRERPECSRRSERVAGNPAAVYNERDLSRAGLAEEERTKSDRRLLKENIREEVYGLEHLAALGGHEKEWTLFQDGYDKSGNRIYDKVAGQTCHQCRQKTLGLRTHCSDCQSLQGVFCGDCLFMRYGENVEEALANSEWKCPLCRDLCNCSFHRSRRGWAPTGTLYRRATAEGFASVAHYLVLNNLAPEARSAALPQMPAELASATRADLEAEASGRRAPQAASRESSPAAPPTPSASGEAIALADHVLDLAPECAASGRGQGDGAAPPAAPAPPSWRGRRQGVLLEAALGAVVKSSAMAVKPRRGAGPKAVPPAAPRVGRGLRSASLVVA